MENFMSIFVLLYDKSVLQWFLENFFISAVVALICLAIDSPVYLVPPYTYIGTYIHGKVAIRGCMIHNQVYFALHCATLGCILRHRVDTPLSCDSAMYLLPWSHSKN